MLRGDLKHRDFEKEAAKLKKGQVLPDGLYLDESDNSYYACQVVVENGEIYFHDEYDHQNKGLATKTNLKYYLPKVRAYIRECKQYIKQQQKRGY